MSIVSIRLYLFLLVLSALVGVSSVYADYHVEVSGWYVDGNGNHTISKSGNVSVGGSITLQPPGNPFNGEPDFHAECRKFGDIEGVYIRGGIVNSYFCRILKSTITVNGTSKSFYLNNESLNDKKLIDTTFVFLPEEVSGSGDTYEWHIEGVIKYYHDDNINGYHEYNETFSDGGTISVGGVVVRKYFVENPEVNLGKGGFVMVMKCYKEGDKTKINVTIVPTLEQVREEVDSNGYKNRGYWGSGSITINNKPFSFNFSDWWDAYYIWHDGDDSCIKTHTWDVTNASTVGKNQPVKSPIPPIAIILALITIPIIALRKLNT
jgi:hypothetical protein